MMLSRTLGFASVMLLGACANSAAYRDLANNTGLVVTTLESGTAEFIAGQNRLNATNAARLDALAADAAAPALAARRQNLAWTAADDTRRLAAFAIAAEPGAADIVAGLNTRATRFPAVASGSTADDYKAAREALVTLSMPPSSGNGLAGLLAFATEVRSNLNTLREEAAAAAAEAETAATTADAAAQSSADQDGR